MMEVKMASETENCGDGSFGCIIFFDGLFRSVN